MIRILLPIFSLFLLHCLPNPKYILREPINGVPKGIVIYGIFLYEETNVPILGKRYDFFIPYPALTTLKRTCKKGEGQSEPCGLNLVRDDAGPEFLREGNFVYFFANRTGLSSDGKVFPFQVLGDMDGSFQYEITNIGSYSSSSRVGTDGTRRIENSYTDYTISNSKDFLLNAPNEKIDFRGIFAYRAEHIKTAPYWVGNIEDGIPVLKKINDPKLNRHFFGEKEINFENAREHAIELLKKDQAKGFWGKIETNGGE